MLLSSITPSDEFAFMRRRGAPKNRELGTSSASLGNPAPVRRSRQLPRRSSRWRKAIAARIDALLPSTDHAATWQQGGGLGPLAEFMLRCVRLETLPDMAGQSTKSTLWRVVVAIAAALGASNAWGLGDEPRPGETVTQYLTPEILQALFPGADKVGEVSGTPPAASVSKGGHQLGYLFSTWDVTQSKGFSNRALILLVGVDPTTTSPRHDSSIIRSRLASSASRTSCSIALSTTTRGTISTKASTSSASYRPRFSDPEVSHSVRPRDRALP